MRTWLRPALISLASTLLTVGALEGIARATADVRLKHPSEALTELFIPDEDTFWGLRPNYHSHTPNGNERWGHEPIKINSLGMRSPEVSEQKPEGVRRVIVLGGSHPMGMWVKRDEAYSAVLERMLNERQPGKWQVLNAAVAGFTSWQGVLQMRSKVPPLGPDIIISDLGINDGLDRVPWGRSRSDHEIPNPPPAVAAILRGLRKHSAAYRWALRRLTERSNPGGEVRVTPDQHLEHAREIAERGADLGAKTLYMNHFMANVTSPGVTNRDGPRCVFEEAELDPVVDVCGIFMDRDDLGGLFADPLHANGIGHRMIAEAVLAKLLELGWVE